MACDEQARHVDVLCFTATHKSDTGRVVLPVEHHADESDSDRAVLPVALECAVENNEEEVQSNTSEEDHILNDSDASDDSHLNDADTSSAVRPGDTEDTAEDNNKDAQQASETLDDNANAISQVSTQQQVLMMIGSTAVRFCSTWISIRTFVLLFGSLAQKKSRSLMQTALSTSFSSTLTTRWPRRIGNSWSLTGKQILSSWRR